MGLYFFENKQLSCDARISVDRSAIRQGPADARHELADQESVNQSVTDDAQEEFIDTDDGAATAAQLVRVHAGLQRRGDGARVSV